MLSFSYEPLHEGSIRLLRVQSSENFDADIVCDLDVAKLDDRPDYAALSYTWGDSKFSKSILVNGIPFSISPSVDFALRSFRATEWQTIWVDQICINQSDILERNKQVSQMHRIYLQALTVFVSLGEGGEDAKLALDMMIDASSAIMQSKSQNGARTQLTTTVGGWRAFGDILLSPWFLRTWTFQEAVACQDLRLLYAGGSVSYDGFYYLFQKHVWALDVLPELLTALNANGNYDTYLTARFAFEHLNFTRKNPMKQNDLFFLVRRLRRRLATDPRDKIYALLSMASDSASFGLLDYSKPTESVYLDFASTMISKYPKLIGFLLAEAGRHQQVLDLPSWVPDWSYPKISFHLGDPVFMQGDDVHVGPEEAEIGDREVKARVEDVDGRPALHIHGWRLDQIIAVGPKLDWTRTGKEWADNVTSWVRNTLASLSPHLGGFIWGEIEESQTSGEGENMQEQFAKVIIANAFNEKNPAKHVDSPPQPSKYAGKALDAFRLLGRESDIYDKEEQELLTMYNSILHNVTVLHCVCVTESRSLGLVPSCAKSSDILAVIEGMRAPAVLREAGDGYLFIGSAYLGAFSNNSGVPIVAKDSVAPDCFKLI